MRGMAIGQVSCAALQLLPTTRPLTYTYFLVVAVCENSNVVTIYGNASAGNVSQWEKKHILEGKGLRLVCEEEWHWVSGI